jgi:hypothetical protein
LVPSETNDSREAASYEFVAIVSTVPLYRVATFVRRRNAS